MAGRFNRFLRVLGRLAIALFAGTGVAVLVNVAIQDDYLATAAGLGAAIAIFLAENKGRRATADVRNGSGVEDNASPQPFSWKKLLQRRSFWVVAALVLAYAFRFQVVDGGQYVYLVNRWTGGVYLLTPYGVKNAGNAWNSGRL